MGGGGGGGGGEGEGGGGGSEISSVNHTQNSFFLFLLVNPHQGLQNDTTEKMHACAKLYVPPILKSALIL